MTVRQDGVAYLDVRTTLESHDGAAILVTYQGVVDLGVQGYDAFARGEMPPLVKLRTSPRLVSSHPAYTWLNRLFCIGIGEYRSDRNEAVRRVRGALRGRNERRSPYPRGPIAA